MTFAAVISDFDGVLADSTGAIRRAWVRWGDRLGIDGGAIQEANHGRPGHAVVAEHVPADRVDAESAWLLEAEIADTDGVVAYPGAAELLARPVVAIATSCAMPLARARLAAAGLVAPPVLVTSDQVVHGKPAPDPYLLAAERLGVDPAACLVVEDAPAGIAAGRAAGMTVWAVATTHAVAELHEAHAVFAGLDGVLDALDAARDAA
jgi:mannitol-1-/sugar-/sorbitol-6-phosphatase